jgi:hypothetical protein
MSQPSNTKRCSGPCGRELDVEKEFYKDASQPSGRKSQCKDCWNEKRNAKPDRAGRGRWENLSEVDLINEVAAGGPALTAFGTPIERASAEALLRCGSVADAAIAMQLEPNELRAHLSELRRRAARRGYSPGHDMTKPTPEGYHVKGVSTYYGIDPDTGDFVKKGQWVKTKVDEEHKVAALLDAMSHLADAWKGKADPLPPRDSYDDDLLCVYPMGDPHLGMFAWAQETGQDFDLNIAEANLVAAVDSLVAGAPAAREALIINLGDFFHADNSTNQTLRSHNALDVDTRWSKVLRVGIRTMRRCIDKALEKHAKVRVICEIGNHDDHSSIMLALCLAQYYEREPRVEIDTSPAKFHWHRFGKNLIGVTHGDTLKPADLPGVMACDRAKDWGETDYRYWYTGHVHHDSLKEFPGVTVETFRTLAPGDAWHRSKGYRSGQDMKMDVLHRKFGKIRRNTIGIQQIVADTFASA